MGVTAYLSAMLSAFVCGGIGDVRLVVGGLATALFGFVPKVMDAADKSTAWGTSLFHLHGFCGSCFQFILVLRALTR